MIIGKNILAHKIGDKALSLGEQSDVRIENININNAHLGLAAKDGSHVKIESINLNNLEFDIALYKKKEFFLRNTNVEIKNLVSDLSNKSYKILKNRKSKLTIDNEAIAKIKVKNSNKIFSFCCTFNLGLERKSRS